MVALQRKDTTRIEALTDGTIAIVMTLLLIELHPPAQLYGIATMGSAFAWYGLSFMLLACLWTTHHNVFHWIAYVDQGVIWLNVTFLMTVGMLPFSTGYMIAYPNERLPQRIYCCNMLCNSMVLWLTWLWAHHRGLTQHDIGAIEAHKAARVLLAPCVGAIVALGLTFIP